MPKASEASTSAQKDGGRGGKPYSRGGRQDGAHGGSKAGGPPRHGGKGRDRPQQGAQSGPGEVGISKIKASLRQTKRLLAKESLAPDVRQEAERRLISLEQDLEARQSTEHDRKNAERYHKVRFFERQKLVRQIKKIKKSIAEASDSKSKGKELQKELHEKRVLLNYVLNFPAKYKYVALFPSQGDSPLVKPVAVAEETESSRRAAKTHEQAKEVRDRVMQAMEKGELSNEPEEELEIRAVDGSAPAKRPRLDLDQDADEASGSPATTNASSAQSSKKSSKTAKKDKKKSKSGISTTAKADTKRRSAIADDDFFAADGDDDASS